MNLSIEVAPTTDITLRKKRLRAAIALYDAEMISQGKAAELAGLSRAAFLEALGQAGVSPFQYSAEEVLKEARL